jgi:hypothetical protein
MAYMNQERKAARMPAIKAALKKYGVSGTVSIRNHSTLIVTLTKGPFEFGHINHYWIEDHYQGAAKDFLIELREAMLGSDYFDHSDAQSDYFHCSHYININAGKWNKPYIHTKQAPKAAA